MPEYGLNIGSRRSVNVITPTFDRDFVTFGTLNHGIGPDITFTRASSATVFTSTGILSTVPNDVPRFEWGSFRTNLLLNSNNFQVWDQVVALSTTSTTDLLGTQTATLVSLTANQQVQGFASNSFIPLSGMSYTFSCYVRKNNINPINLLFRFRNGIGNGSAYADLGLNTNTGFNSFIPYNADGGPVNPLAETSTYRIEDLSTWWRISITANGMPSEPIRATIRSFFAPTSAQYTLWNAQVEPGLSATNYIPTTTSAVTTGVPLGLLIEEGRTNLVPTNNVFNWFYNSNNVSVSAGSGFAGLSSYIISDISNSVRESAMFDFLSPLLTATPYTVSCYIRKDLTANNFNPLIRVRDTNDNYFGTSFNEALGTWQIGQSGPNSGLTFITNVSTVDLNTHFRHWFTFSTPTTARPYQFQIFGAHGTTAPLPSTGSIEVAGIQVEQGSFPTSYIPTAGLSATRAGDSAIVTPINSFYNQEQGTLFTEARTSRWTINSLMTVVAFDQAASASNNTFRIIRNGPFGASANDKLISVYRSGAGPDATSLQSANGTWPIDVVAKVAAAYRVNDFAASLNGSNALTDTSGAVTTMDRMWLGNWAMNEVSNGYIRKVTYWPTRLSNNRLRILTLSA